MTKFDRSVAVCLATTCIVLASCAGQKATGPDQQKISSLGSIRQDKNTVSNPLEPAATVHSKSRQPSQPSDTEGPVKPTVGIAPPAINSGQKATPQPAPDARQLVGLNGDGLTHLLGKPALLRQEAEVEVWQYRTADCVLHLFLYRDVANSSRRVVHVEAVHSVRSGALSGNAGSALLVQKTLLQSCFGRLLHQATALNKSS